MRPRRGVGDRGEAERREPTSGGDEPLLQERGRERSHQPGEPVFGARDEARRSRIDTLHRAEQRKRPAVQHRGVPAPVTEAHGMMRRGGLELARRGEAAEAPLVEPFTA